MEAAISRAYCSMSLLLARLELFIKPLLTIILVVSWTPFDTELYCTIRRAHSHIALSDILRYTMILC